jgi:hypothetical protein
VTVVFLAHFQAQAPARGADGESLPQPARWYHGKIDRHEAESRLKATEHTTNVFLVRSKESDGEFALSILSQGRAIHYVVSLPETADGPITLNKKVGNPLFPSRHVTPPSCHVKACQVGMSGHFALYCARFGPHYGACVVGRSLCFGKCGSVSERTRGGGGGGHQRLFLKVLVFGRRTGGCWHLCRPNAHVLGYRVECTDNVKTHRQCQNTLTMSEHTGSVKTR